jgi:hypothetical protein
MTKKMAALKTDAMMIIVRWERPRGLDDMAFSSNMEDVPTVDGGVFDILSYDI